MNGLIDLQQLPASDILQRMTALGDPIRGRILLLLERQELTVTELCAILQSPQSTVSRHLKVLASDGWVSARKEGTSRRYSARSMHPDSLASRLWQLVREAQIDNSVSKEDSRRLESILAQRRSRSRNFFSTAAARWAEMRCDLFGQRFDLEGLLGLLDGDWTIADLGTGTGQLAKALAPYVSRIVAVDDSPAMLDAAAKRLAGIENVDIRHGSLESLPIEGDSLDVATLILVLHHLAEPELVLAEAVRALRPGGRLLVVDMLPHEREEFRQEMGHVWLGFAEDQMATWLEQVGLCNVRIRQLTPDPEAKGPGLFSATATKPDAKRLTFPVPGELRARAE